MLKIKKKKDSEVKYDAVADDDAVQSFVDDWLADFCKDHPELADAISAPLITKSALDSALDNGIYRMDSEDVADKIREIKDHYRKGQNKDKTRKNRPQNNTKRRGANGKGLRKPHTSI